MCTCLIGNILQAVGAVGILRIMCSEIRCKGPWYAAPFVGVYSDNHMAFTKYVGGVCGGLSHFGAASACANGVPALTAVSRALCIHCIGKRYVDSCLFSELETWLALDAVE